QRIQLMTFRLVILGGCRDPVNQHVLPRRVVAGKCHPRREFAESVRIARFLTQAFNSEFSGAESNGYRAHPVHHQA
ncbi:MAG TPA: hypothetical protein PLW86_14510, partial [Rhodocyclaceae bacterium]|nr:hypothetical protein [Rhodocyclaceae bacterium]